eukprot:scaffold4074_cov149-Skeletonema_menzelii.AAC.1
MAHDTHKCRVGAENEASSSNGEKSLSIEAQVDTSKYNKNGLLPVQLPPRKLNSLPCLHDFIYRCGRSHEVGSDL